MATTDTSKDAKLEEEDEFEEFQVEGTSYSPSGYTLLNKKEDGC